MPTAPLTLVDLNVLQWMRTARDVHHLSDDDILATFTELTAAAIVDSYKRFGRRNIYEVIVSGGGARNVTMMRRIAARLHAEIAPGIPVYAYEEKFPDLNGDAKEAMLFAYLAFLHAKGLPGNVVSVTGCRGPRILGKRCYAPPSVGAKQQ